MNHYLLPHARASDGRNTRYGDDALPRLLEQLCRAGALQHRLRAKLYGGARTLARDGDIGEMNIALALEFLREHDIPIADTDLGGRTARLIKFHPASGRSFIRTTARRTLRSPAHGSALAAIG